MAIAINATKELKKPAAKKSSAKKAQDKPQDDGK